MENHATKFRLKVDVDVEENTNAQVRGASLFHNPISMRRCEGSRSEFVSTPRQVRLFLAGIYRQGSLRTGLKPGDSSQDNVSKEKSKNILGASFAIPCKGGEEVPASRRARETEREREMVPTPFAESETPLRMANAHATGEGRRGGEESGGRTRARGRREIRGEKDGEERPALLRVFGADSGGGGGGGGGASFS